MKTVETGRFVAAGSARPRGAEGAPGSRAIGLGIVEGRAARPVARRCTAEEVARSGLRVIGGAGVVPGTKAGAARDLARPAWVKVLWVGTVLVSAGAIYLGAL